jgi:Spy/CpxP family protein refolding chaperone
MQATRVTKFTAQVVAAAVCLLAFSVAASAQKAKPAGPPVTTKGMTKANEHAAKGQATAESKRAKAREDKAERAETKAAREEPGRLLKGIKLTKAERTSVNDVEKKYRAQLKDLEKQEDAAEKAGTPMADFATRVTALRTQERADIRAVLTPAQATQFDKNAATVKP